MKKSDFLFSVEDIVEGGLMVAAAIILDFIKIPFGPTGGSINLQMLPLMIYSLRKGWFKGLLVSGLVYGAVTCITDASGSLANFPFDYLIGFGSCCLMGILKGRLVDSSRKWSLVDALLISAFGLLTTMVRIAGSTLSSMIVYGYDLVPALIYNVTYVSVSGVAAFLVLMVLYRPLSKLPHTFGV